MGAFFYCRIVVYLVNLWDFFNYVSSSSLVDILPIYQWHLYQLNKLENGLAVRN